MVHYIFLLEWGKSEIRIARNISCFNVQILVDVVTQDYWGRTTDVSDHNGRDFLSCRLSLTNHIKEESNLALEVSGIVDTAARKGIKAETSMLANHEARCWGCGLNLLLPSYSPIFKCGWCGAITNHNISRKSDGLCFSLWRRARDRFFVTILFVFISFVICAGIWAVYPIVFSISYSCGIFHCTLTTVLAICTISAFLCASFRSAGKPASVVWSSYPVVEKGALENYTFCTYCAKPKCPRTHHCRSCRKCVLDMDHHCPFIGNCVGAANHRCFVAFLISIVVSCTYVVAMAVFSVARIWPTLEYGPPGSLTRLSRASASGIVKHVFAAIASSALVLPVRGFILVYLAMACFSVEIGICVLLFQQLHFIYEGKTYLNSLKSKDNEFADKGCHNIIRFFSCPYWVSRLLLGSSYSGKVQESSNPKTL